MSALNLSQIYFDPLRNFSFRLRADKHPEWRVLQPYFNRLLEQDSLGVYVDLMDSYHLAQGKNIHTEAEFGAGIALFHRALMRHPAGSVSYGYAAESIWYLECGAAKYIRRETWTPLQEAVALTIALFRSGGHQSPRTKKRMQVYWMKKACLIQERYIALFDSDSQASKPPAVELVEYRVSQYLNSFPDRKYHQQARLDSLQYRSAPSRMDSPEFCSWLAEHTLRTHIPLNYAGIYGLVDAFRLMIAGHPRLAMMLCRGIHLECRKGFLHDWALYGDVLATMQELMLDPSLQPRDKMLCITQRRAKEASARLPGAESTILMILLYTLFAENGMDTTIWVEKGICLAEDVKRLSSATLDGLTPAHLDAVITRLRLLTAR